MNPEPLPAPSRWESRAADLRTSIFTTLGLIASATRVTASTNHPPGIIYLLLVTLSLLGALLVGYGTSPNKDRSLLHQGTFALVTSLAIYVIIDLEYPRLGLIRIDTADQALIRHTLTIGLVYRPIPQIAVKGDYMRREFGAGAGFNELAAALAWMF